MSTVEANIHSAAVNRECQRATTRRWRSPLRRFVVAEASMEPTLVAGQGLLATPFGRARPGQIRVFEHPDRPGFWLVKRVDAVDGDSMMVASDNASAPGAVDSRVLGSVPIAGSFRTVLRIPRRWM